MRSMKSMFASTRSMGRPASWARSNRYGFCRREAADENHIDYLDVASIRCATRSMS